MTSSGQGPQGPEIRLGLRAQWTYRAHAEHEASYRFRGLFRRLRDRGVDRETLALAEQAIVDEEVHRGSCAEEARRWGASELRFACPRLREPTTGNSKEQTLQFEIVTMCCLAETINSIYLSEVVRLASDQGVRERTRSILADEIRHARLGWRFLATTGADLGWLSPHMPRILQTTIREDVFGDGNGDIVSKDHGLLARSEMAHLFVASVREVVVPGLSDFGVNPTHAIVWLDAVNEGGASTHEIRRPTTGSAQAPRAVPRNPRCPMVGGGRASE